MFFADTSDLLVKTVERSITGFLAVVVALALFLISYKLGLVISIPLSLMGGLIGGPILYFAGAYMVDSTSELVILKLNGRRIGEVLGGPIWKLGKYLDFEIYFKRNFTIYYPAQIVEERSFVLFGDGQPTPEDLAYWNSKLPEGIKLTTESLQFTDINLSGDSPNYLKAAQVVKLLNYQVAAEVRWDLEGKITKASCYDETFGSQKGGEAQIASLSENVFTEIAGKASVSWFLKNLGAIRILLEKMMAERLAAYSPQCQDSTEAVGYRLIAFNFKRIMTSHSANIAIQLRAEKFNSLAEAILESEKRAADLGIAGKKQLELDKERMESLKVDPTEALRLRSMVEMAENISSLNIFSGGEGVDLLGMVGKQYMGSQAPPTSYQPRKKSK